MNRFKYISILFMTLAVSAISCSKDDDSSGNDDFPFGEIHLTAKIDDEKFVATQVNAADQWEEGESDFIMLAEDNSGKGWMFGITDFDGVGTYIIKDEEGGVLFLDENTDTGWWAEEGGKIVITHYKPGERIKGTFEFTLNNLDNDVREVTEGSFESEIVDGED